MMRSLAIVLFGLAIVPALPEALCSAEPAGDDYFEQRIRPILVEKCLSCHGDEEPEGDFKLTSRANVLKGGQSGPAAVAHKPNESLLVKAVRQTSRPKMPPDEKLTASQIADLASWVEMGLPWPEAAGIVPAKQEMVILERDRQHWSYLPITNPMPPSIRDIRWAKTPVDQFVLAKLETAGLHPSPPADRRTLIRRASYDLIGLPPTWDEVQAFQNDRTETSQAFAKVVERLLSSPAYGERWARHWLDIARFADTKDGVLMYGDDRVRPYAYTYRDYVIRAMNEDLPFNRFIQEQLAADLIEPRVEPWRLAAMGFLTLGRMYDNNIHDIIDDQIDTVSRGFLGLTVSCARCHDHKYDPIPTRDYYSLYGVFASCEIPIELPLTEHPENIPGGPEFEKDAAAKRAELLKFRDSQYELLSESARNRVTDYLIRVATTKPDPLETAIFFLSLAPEDLRPPIVAKWRRFIEQRAIPDDPVFGLWHDLMQLPDVSSSTSGTPVETSPSDRFSVQAMVVVEKWKQRPDGIQPGELNPLVKQAFSSASINDRASVARTYGELLKKVYDDWKLSRSSAGTASPPVLDPASQQLIEIIISRDSPTFFPKSQTRRYMSRTETDAYGGKIQELDRMAVKSPGAPPRAMVMYDSDKPYDPHIFVRGNPTQPGKRVPRQFLEILSNDGRKAFEKGSGRLELATAIASDSNPLTARVIVNRLWMFHFGEPLVSTPSDFGKRSSMPTHPELLDHLATRFINDGWSLKSLHRMMMNTNTYQQAAAPNVAARAIDPDNRLLWTARRQRLDFESMRDTLLSVSGRLECRSGGRPVDIAADPQSRVRTIYGLIDRQSLPGVFRAFDFATPDQSVERRPRTMVPQQALFAINSPFVVVQAKDIAKSSTLKAQATPEDRIAAIYRQVLGRDPTQSEQTAALEFVSLGKDDASQLETWEQLAQVLLCSNELMYLD